MDPLCIECRVPKKAMVSSVSLKFSTSMGSLGFGSVRREERESITLYSESAGDQLVLRMSMQTLPRSEMFMWYILVVTRSEDGTFTAGMR